MFSMRFEITGDRAMFERASKAGRNVRPFMRKVGVQLMGSAVRRLETVLKQDTASIRTGTLGNSLHVGPEGEGGSPDTIFELTDLRVTVGTNVRYAAQVQFGVRIVPKPPRKALAIPLPDRLKREGLWPSELDPNREILSFVPVRGGSSGNVIGLLVDEENDFGFGEDEPLYALATHVDQLPRPFLFIDDEDKRVIEEDLFPAHFLETGN